MQDFPCKPDCLDILFLSYGGCGPRVAGIGGKRRERDRLPQREENFNALLLKAGQEGVDIMGVLVRDFSGNEDCLERFFCCLLCLKAEIFVENTRGSGSGKGKGAFLPGLSIQPGCQESAFFLS